MKLLELTADEYRSIYPPRHVFASTEFSQLNAAKVGRVHYLSMVDDKAKHKLGIIVGETEARYSCPFSAPFGDIAYNSVQSLECIDAFLDLLREHLSGKPIRLTLPPMIYDDLMLPKLEGMAAGKAKSSYYDFNYHYELQQFEEFAAHLDRSARNHFNRSLNSGFTFEKTDDISRAYSVIQRNRMERGFPLRMTEEQVRQTVKDTVRADFFVMSLGDADVAAAMVYHVSADIVQVIYWGNVAGFNEYRPMNMLAYKVMEYYYNLGMKIVDIGPSSEDGVPNYGLCSFKEAIGCKVTLKPTFFM